MLELSMKIKQQPGTLCLWLEKEECPVALLTSKESGG